MKWAQEKKEKKTAQTLELGAEKGMNEKGYTEAMVSTIQYMNMYKSQQNIQCAYTVPAASLFCHELNKWFVLEKEKSPAGTAC